MDTRHIKSARRYGLRTIPFQAALLAVMFTSISVAPALAATRGRPARTVSAWSAPNAYPKSTSLRDAVESLFTSYEREDPMKLMSVVADDFVANDNSGLANRRSEFEQAVRDDFTNLNMISFEPAIIEAVTVTERGTLAVIRTIWTRRSRASLTGEEWLLVAERSNLIMRWDGKAWKLIRVEGASLFGNSDRFGRITLNRGTVAGAASTGSITNGQLVP